MRWYGHHKKYRVKKVSLAPLCRKLGYEFNQEEFLRLALTHRSKGSKNYERLEFLGDSILGFVVADWLYEQFPKLAEGNLSRMRASVVRKETLAVVARQLQLGDFLILGEGELKSGGFNRDSILSDAVESIIGAIYLDSDFAHASKFIFEKFAAQLEQVHEQLVFKDAKSRLQELMQKQALSLPVYQIIETSGAQHEQEFSVECSLPDLTKTAIASGSTRRLAEQIAAQYLLDALLDKQTKGADKLISQGKKSDR